jgi:hypothetical protein
MWFSSNNCARELSLVKTVLSGCHAMPRFQCVLVVLSAGNDTSEVEVNSITRTIAVEKNVWDCTSTPQYVATLFRLVKHRDNVAFTSSKYYFWKIF